MSVLGISFDERGVRLSCRPDPAKPPLPLDACCSFQVPALVAVDETVRPGGVVQARELFDQCFPGDGAARPDWLPEAVATWFRELLSAIDRDIDAQVVLLGGVEHLVVVAPPRARSAEMESLRGMAGRSSLPVTVVAHHAACLAGQLGRFEAMRPFLVCEWNDDLVCRTFLAHDTFCHLSPAGEPRRRKELGPAGLGRQLAKALAAKVSKPPSASVLERVRTRAAMCVEAILAGGNMELASESERNAGSRSELALDALLPDKPQGSPEESTSATGASAVDEIAALNLSEDEIITAWAPVLTLAGNFAAAAAREARRNGVGVAVLSGRMFRSALLLRAVRDALQAGGIESVSESVHDSALLGVHYCVRARPLLPYDCGFLLKRPDAPLGIGTLVLVRPAAIGEERQSEAMELPLPASASLEISFYTRRLDEGARNVIYDVMRKHVFVPSRNSAGEARIRVSMRVEQGEQQIATVSVDIHDLNSNEHIRFERLPLIGESELNDLPLRDARQLPALDWLGNIQKARESSRPPATLTEWRQALENRSPRLPRAAYANFIINAVREVIRAVTETFDKEVGVLADGLTTWLGINKAVESRDPEDFQSEGRRLLFETMRRAAGLIADNGGRHCRAWLRSNAATEKVPAEESCTKNFINSVSQDRASAEDDCGLMPALTELQVMFHHTCSSPFALNIAW